MVHHRPPARGGLTNPPRGWVGGGSNPDAEGARGGRALTSGDGDGNSRPDYTAAGFGADTGAALGEGTDGPSARAPFRLYAECLDSAGASLDI